MRIASWSVLLIALAALAAACEPVSTPTPPKPTVVGVSTPIVTSQPTATAAPTPSPVPKSKVLRIGRVGYPNVIDPQRSASGNGIEVLRLVYEGLFSIDDKGNPGPGGADKCDLSSDSTSMTCHIRDGLKRADGTPITAKDYEYALKRAIDPRVTGKPLAYLLYDVKGAEALDVLDPAKAQPADIDKAFSNYGVTATDDKTLVVTFKRPVGYWQFIASSNITYPSDGSQVAKDPDNWWTKPEGQNGNGPFKIKSIDAGKRIVLIPNENYWRGRPKLERIEFVYGDSKTLLDAYKSGTVDLVTGLAPDELTAVNADSTLKAESIQFPVAATYALTFNSSRKPFNDKNVRLAFSQALDRDGWVRDVLKGRGKPYTRWIPPGVPGAQPDKAGVPGYDPKAAVLTLVSNGYATTDSTPAAPKVDCGKLGEIRLTFNNASSSQVAAAQFLAVNFAKALGCPIALESVDPAVYEAMSQGSKTAPQIALSIWIQDYPYPQNWLSTYWTCNSGFSARYGYCNKDLDAQLAKSDREPDPQKALQMYQDAEDVLLRDVPAAFANYVELGGLVKPYVIGPGAHISSGDLEWAGEWGPVLDYDIDLSRVSPSYQP